MQAGIRAPSCSIGAQEICEVKRNSGVGQWGSGAQQLGEPSRSLTFPTSSCAFTSSLDKLLVKRTSPVNKEQRPNARSLPFALVLQPLSQPSVMFGVAQLSLLRFVTKAQAEKCSRATPCDHVQGLHLGVPWAGRVIPIPLKPRLMWCWQGM